MAGIIVRFGAPGIVIRVPNCYNRSHQARSRPSRSHSREECKMGEILGIGVTHFPGLMLPDAYMSSFLTRTLESDRVPAEMKEPARWPEPLRQELAANENGGAAAEHRRRLVGGFRKA